MEDKLRAIGQMLELSPGAQVLCAGDRVIDMSGAAKKLFPGTGPEDQIEKLLGDYAEDYRSYSGTGTMMFPADLVGLTCEVTVTALDQFRLITVTPENQDMGVHTLAAITVNLRKAMNAVVNAKHVLLPRLDETKDNMEKAAWMNRGIFSILRMAANMELYHNFASGEVILQTQRTDLGAWLEEMAQRMQPLVEQGGRKLVWHYPADRCYMDLDPQRMERALLNLVSNAMKFSEPGGVIDLRVRHRGTHLVLTVTDQGCGIPADRMGQVYNWSQFKGRFPDPRCGVGLGLPLARYIVQAHGGRMMVESREGEGTVVHMDFSTERRWPKENVLTGIQMPDYAGGMDHVLLELSDAMPNKAYDLRGIDL